MTTIYLTRHGQTEWNKAQIMQGWQNSPLTHLGNKQAYKLGERLKSILFDAIFSSDSDRAFHTAKIITQNQNQNQNQKQNQVQEINKLTALREINLGEWEGKSISEFEQSNPIEYQNFWKSPHLYTSSTGENFFDVKERVIPAIEKIIHQHSQECVLIVAHTVVVKIILAYFDDEPIQKLWNSPFIHPTSLSIIHTNNHTKKISFYGDTSHYNE